MQKTGGMNLQIHEIVGLTLLQKFRNMDAISGSPFPLILKGFQYRYGYRTSVPGCIGTLSSTSR